MQKIAIYFIAAMVAPICMISCAFEPDRKAPRFTDHGQVFFYLSCSKRPTFDISFSISGMSFMNKEGVWIDVALDKRIHSAELAERQIKLSEFYLPAGKYKRIKWRKNRTVIILSRMRSARPAIIPTRQTRGV